MPWRVTVKFKDTPGLTYDFPGKNTVSLREWMREKTNAINRRYAKTGGKATFEYVEDSNATSSQQPVGVRR